MTDLRKAIDEALTCDKGCGHTMEPEVCYQHQVDKVQAIIEAPKTVNRLEVIDHTPSGSGRDYVKWENYDFEITESIQDRGHTLKIFLRGVEKP